MGFITSKNYAGKEVRLLDNVGLPVKVGDKFVTSRDEQVEVTGGRAPHKASSTGRVYCNIVVDEHGHECDNPIHAEWFPGVINCKWEE